MWRDKVGLLISYLYMCVCIRLGVGLMLGSLTLVESKIDKGRGRRGWYRVAGQLVGRDPKRCGWMFFLVYVCVCSYFTNPSSIFGLGLARLVDWRGDDFLIRSLGA